MTTTTPLPLFCSNLRVRAFKIASVQISTQGAILVPDDKQYCIVDVGNDYLSVHRPKPGGYYVINLNGNETYRPADFFESHYTRVDDEQEEA